MSRLRVFSIVTVLGLLFWAGSLFGLLLVVHAAVLVYARRKVSLALADENAIMRYRLRRQRRG